MPLALRNARRLKMVKPGIFEFVPRLSMFTQYGSKTFFHDSWNDADCKMEWLSDLRPKKPVVTEEHIGLNFEQRCNHPEWLRDAPSGQVMVGYRRTRVKNGEKTTLLELTKSGPLGCLRTYSGGSSVPQLIAKVQHDLYSTIKLPTHIAMICMGFEQSTLKLELRLTSGHPNEYILPDNYSDAFHIIGDAVVPQCVTFLMSEMVYPLLKAVAGLPAMETVETV